MSRPSLQARAREPKPGRWGRFTGAAVRTLRPWKPCPVGSTASSDTINANLAWDLYLNALGPCGGLHTVGVVPDPIPALAFTLIAAQRSIPGSPFGSPATILDMLEFCLRHGI